MAFEMLRRHDFAETVWHFSRTLRAMAAKAGKPQAFIMSAARVPPIRRMRDCGNLSASSARQPTRARLASVAERRPVPARQRHERAPGIRPPGQRSAPAHAAGSEH